MEVFPEHHLVSEQNARNASQLWLKFIVEFGEANQLDGPRQIQERRLARRALSQLPQNHLSVSQNLRPTHDRYERDDIHHWHREELQAFLPYLDALRTNQNTALHREAIYGTYLRLLGLFQKRYWQVLAKEPNSAGNYVGYGNELVAGALLARLRHPNIQFVPAMAMQDGSAGSRYNHDYVYIDTLGDSPVVQPTQVKAAYTSLTHGYDPSIAMLIGEADLHVCQYTGQECCDRTPSGCVVKRTATFLLEEATPRQRDALDALTNGLLIKLSDWHDNPDHWRAVTAYERRSARFQKRYDRLHGNSEAE